MVSEPNQGRVGWPKTFDSCPNCGEIKTLTDELKAEEVAAGKIRETTHIALLVAHTLIADPGMIDKTLSVPAIISAWDACAACGTLYVKHAHIQSVMRQGPGGINNLKL